jgi:phosphoglycerate kinase
LSGTIEPVYHELKKHIDVSFVPDVLGEGVQRAIDSMRDGNVVLLENIRRADGEIENDKGLAEKLATFGNFYVNDAFGVSHRVHSSVVAITKFLPSYAGIQMQSEVDHLLKARKPTGTSIAILGGMKFDAKEPLVEKFLGSYERVAVVGALANSFLRARGYEIGLSLASTADTAQKLVQSEKLILPVDVVVESGGHTSTKNADQVAPDETIVDVGPETVAQLAHIVENSSYVLWNGPLGKYERGYGKPTEELASAIAGSRAYSVIGGGDTIAAIESCGLEDQFSFVSTGGGAMLQFLLDGTLPGIEALKYQH